MTAKTLVATDLGEAGLLLPALIVDGLRANDRAKYYLSLLQACREHAIHPDAAPRNLRAEREASGIDDVSLDHVAAETQLATDGAMFVSRAEEIHQQLLASVAQMIAPLRVHSGDAEADAESYEHRLGTLIAQLPQPVGDSLLPGYVQAVTRAERRGPDSLHLLVMDLHREINRLQATLAEEVIDGAQVYGLGDSDAALVRAFMTGVNATAGLKFDHPGLGTTATHAGTDLVIQNDLGTTDAHVIVIHVNDQKLSLIYTDVHRPRLQFFQAMLEKAGVEWSAGSGGAEYETIVGRRACDTREQLLALLELIGSRLVFLIDWNRARKRLSRFVKKAEAITVLTWAAEAGYGHRAFLESGGERLIYDALERTASLQLRWGARLDDILGVAAAAEFLQAVLRMTSEALQQRRSLRLVRDEVQAELSQRLQESPQGVLTLAADHAALIVALAVAVRDQITRVAGPEGGKQIVAAAARAKRWETKADEIVSQARQAHRHLPEGDVFGPLLPSADDAADALEDAMFLLTLLQNHDRGQRSLDGLQHLAHICVAGAEEYVRCLVIARDVRHVGTAEDVRQFLVAVDRLIALEHDSDNAERQAEAAALTSAVDFRALHLLHQVGHQLEEAVDALARCALLLKDNVMAGMLVG